MCFVNLEWILVILWPGYVCESVYVVMNTVLDDSPICLIDHVVAMLLEVCFILADVSEV